MSFAIKVKKELTEMKRIGINIPDNVFKRCSEDLSEYKYMKVSYCADLLINLYS